MSSTKNRMIMGAFSHDRIVQLYNMLSEEAGLKETRDEAIKLAKAEFYEHAGVVAVLLRLQESEVYEKLLKILDAEEIRVVVRDAIMHYFSSVINITKFFMSKSDLERFHTIWYFFDFYIVKYTHEALSNHPTIRSKFSFFKKSRTREIARELSKALEESSVRHYLLGDGYSRTLNYSTYVCPYSGDILPKFVSYVDEDGNVVL